LPSASTPRTSTVRSTRESQGLRSQALPASTTGIVSPGLCRNWPYEEGHARDWIATHEARWDGDDGADLAVTATGDGRLLGSLGFVAFDWDGRVTSVGYWVAADERGRGVATRALRLGTDWALTSLGLGTVELVTMVGNVASERVAGVLHGR
jgi:RimJ/RimL family protein N-acetyltransferase